MIQYSMPEFDFDEKNDFTDEELEAASRPAERIVPGQRATLKILSAKWNGPASDPTWHKLNLIIGLPGWTATQEGDKTVIKDANDKRTSALYHTLMVPTKNIGFIGQNATDSSPNVFMTFTRFMLGLGYDVHPGNFRERIKELFDPALTRFIGKTFEAVPGYLGNYYAYEDKVCRIVDLNGKPVKIRGKVGGEEKDIPNEFRNRQEAYVFALQYKVKVDENPMMRLIAILPGQDTAEAAPVKKKFDD